MVRWNPDGLSSARRTMLEGEEENDLSGLPSDYMSHNTSSNITANKGRIDYCVTTFQYLENRIKCIDQLTGGPFLA